MNGKTGLNYDLKDLEIVRSMLDFGLILYGKCTSKMDDNDPRIEISAGAKLIGLWEHMGCDENWQRDQIDIYDEAKEALATYRSLKAGVGVVPINQAVALHILKANLSDGAKVAALAGLVAGAATARDIATITNRSIRSVERHHAELRTWECAELRREKEKKYAEVRTSECADVRSHDHGEGSTNATGKADASPGAQASKACAA